MLFVLITVVSAYCVSAAPMDTAMAPKVDSAPMVPTMTDSPMDKPMGCSDGIKEGDTVERGRYWYACQNGDLVLKGCMSQKKTRMNAGDTYITSAFVIECAADGKDGFVFKYKGCVSETQEPHPVDTTWQDDNYWYQCMADNTVPKIIIQGCVANGKRTNIGESVKAGDLIYICTRKSEGTVGFDIYPNHQDKDATFSPLNPADDLIYKKQNVPVFINQRR